MAIVPRLERPQLKIRQPTIRLSALTPHYWFANNPIATHFMNALSCLLPPAESFFVRSVLRYRAAIHDRELNVEVRNFAGQESIHHHEYGKVTQWLDDYGLPASKVTQMLDQYWRQFSRFIPAKFCIAYTAALEHIIAAIGHGILSDRALVHSIHPDVRSLWLWHAMEEIEHKSVAFDVARAAGVGYFFRCSVMVFSLICLVMSVGSVQMIFLIKDKQCLNLAAYLKACRMGFGRKLVQRVASYICIYFRRDFHPWRIDERPLLRAGRLLLKESLMIQKNELIPHIQSPVLSMETKRLPKRKEASKMPPFRYLFAHELGSDVSRREVKPIDVQKRAGAKA